MQKFDLLLDACDALGVQVAPAISVQHSDVLTQLKFEEDDARMQSDAKLFKPLSSKELYKWANKLEKSNDFREADRKRREAGSREREEERQSLQRRLQRQGRTKSKHDAIRAIGRLIRTASQGNERVEVTATTNPASIPENGLCDDGQDRSSRAGEDDDINDSEG